MVMIEQRKFDALDGTPIAVYSAAPDSRNEVTANKSRILIGGYFGFETRSDLDEFILLLWRAWDEHVKIAREVK